MSCESAPSGGWNSCSPPTCIGCSRVSASRNSELVGRHRNQHGSSLSPTADIRMTRSGWVPSIGMDVNKDSRARHRPSSRITASRSRTACRRRRSSPRARPPSMRRRSTRSPARSAGSSRRTRRRRTARRPVLRLTGRGVHHAVRVTQLSDVVLGRVGVIGLQRDMADAVSRRAGRRVAGRPPRGSRATPARAHAPTAPSRTARSARRAGRAPRRHRRRLRVPGRARCGSMSAGAASRNTRPAARTSCPPVHTITAATTSDAIGSARVQPVVSTTTPATTVAANAHTSVTRCATTPRTFSVDRSARPARPVAAQIHDDADERDHGNDAAACRRRMDQPQDGLDGEPDRQQDQRDPAELAGQRIDAGEPVGVGAARRPPRDPRRHDRQSQRTGVGEHVRGVGDQRQRMGEQPGDDLGDHEREHHRERGREPAPIGGCRPAVVMPVRSSSHPLSHNAMPHT